MSYQDHGDWQFEPASFGSPVAGQRRSDGPSVQVKLAAIPHADAYRNSPGNTAFQAGVAAFIDQDDETALAQLESAIAADPLIDEAPYILGLTLLRLGRRDEAIRALEQTLAVTRNEVLRDYAVNKLAELGVGVHTNAATRRALHASGGRPAVAPTGRV